MIATEQKTSTVSRIQELVSQQWPEAVYVGDVAHGDTFPINVSALRILFPDSGIPAGQLLEITGGVSSGKTTVLMQLLAGISQGTQIIYVDFGRTFFPPAAAAAGIDLSQVLLLRPESLPEGIRAAELLLQQGQARCVVFELVGRNERVPPILLHRLRQLILKSKAVALFLTEDSSRALPASLIALQLTVTKTGSDTIEIVTTKSRLTCEGTKAKLVRC